MFDRGYPSFIQLLDNTLSAVGVVGHLPDIELLVIVEDGLNDVVLGYNCSGS